MKLTKEQLKNYWIKPWMSVKHQKKMAKHADRFIEILERQENSQ